MEEDHEEQESGNEETEVDESIRIRTNTDNTINISDIRHGGLPDRNNDYEYDKRRDRKSRQKFSQVWTKFTIVDHNDCLATCNICGARLSYKTTITNLAKHITRKHNYNPTGFKVVPSLKQKKKHYLPRSSGEGSDRKRTLTELGGLDGLLLNVVADEGEDPTEVGADGGEVSGEQVVYAEEVGEYTYTIAGSGGDESHKSRFTIRSEDIENGYDSDRDPEYRPGKYDKDSDDSMHGNISRTKKSVKDKAQTPTRPRPPDRRNLSLEAKKERLVDLQLECLELKKYTMQMEALAMEHQLCIPRSIFTEPLRSSNQSTRSTQTDVGGGNTRVFYVSDKSLVNGDQASPQLFTFQARMGE